MNRQQKFAEQGAYGERVGRTAYALEESALPEPAAGLRWHHIEDFDAGDLASPSGSIDSLDRNGSTNLPAGTGFLPPETGAPKRA